MSKEKKFFDALKDIFVGAKIEGKSGFINLMHIKSSYYEKGIYPILQNDIDTNLKEFPDFREEFFDKLYTFFNRYFSESGSIYFRRTYFHREVYDKIYSNEKDIILFWKLNMLYYVKSDVLFENLDIEFEGKKFHFDVSGLELKKAYEKRDLVFSLKEIAKDKKIIFNVEYSVSRKKTKIDQILKKLREMEISEEILNGVFRIFEKQNEVDYFINKEAGEFLKEQFNLWLHQYTFTDESDFSAQRVKQLKILKNVAENIIDFISKFEDELLAIWRKPKFVLNSNYVLTLGKIAKRKEGIELIKELAKDDNFQNQIKEWLDLKIIKDFDQKKLFNNTLQGNNINPRYKNLPIDTKYFKTLEQKLLTLFDNLDSELDGWLIKSENWQALNTIEKKFNGKIQTIFIDPPFNKKTEADYLYRVKFKDSTWLTILENRLDLAKKFISNKGCIFVRCDDNGNMLVRFLMDTIFGPDQFKNELIVNRTQAKKTTDNQFVLKTDSLFFYTKSDNFVLYPVERKREPIWYKLVDFPRANTNPRTVLGTVYHPPMGRRWGLSQGRINLFEEKGNVRINEEESYVDCNGNTIQGFPELLYDFENVGNEWLDIPGYSQAHGFKTENSEILLKRVIESTSLEGDIIFDFFLGSGTATASAHKMKRRWLGVEMGEQFYTHILPRMKQVLGGEQSGISKQVKWGGGGFFKYYELEQYENTLGKVKYEKSDYFHNPYEDPYNSYIFLKDMKLLEAIKIDTKKKIPTLDLEKIFSFIDIPEILSHKTGKPIKKITTNTVEFEDGEIIDFANLEFSDVKPYIWW